MTGKAFESVLWEMTGANVIDDSTYDWYKLEYFATFAWVRKLIRERCHNP